MTNQEVQKAAKHAEHLRSVGEKPLQYLDHNFSKDGGIKSDWNRVYAAWQDLIEPDSSYGERARQVFAAR